MKKARTSHKGRKCKFLHCKHILSIYNHEAYCHIHLGQFTPLETKGTQKKDRVFL